MSTTTPPLHLVTGVLVRVDGSAQSFNRPVEGRVGDIINANNIDAVSLRVYFTRQLAKLGVTAEERRAMVGFVDDEGVLVNKPPHPWDIRIRGSVYFEAYDKETGEPKSLAPEVVEKLTKGWK